MLYSSLIRAALVVLILSSVAQTALGGKITEIVFGGAPGSDTSYPAYVEVYAPFADGPMDLVVLQAFKWSSHAPLVIATIMPKLSDVAGTETYVVHEGDWPSTSPGEIPTEEMRTKAGDNLHLRAVYGAVRTVLLFDHDIGLTVAASRQDILAEGGLLDVVTYSTLEGRPVYLFGDEPVHYLTGDNNGLLRLRNSKRYLPSFIQGQVIADEHGPRFLDGPRLNPGLVNMVLPSPIPTPEPSTLLALALLAPPLLSRRSRPGPRRRQRATSHTTQP